MRAGSVVVAAVSFDFAGTETDPAAAALQHRSERLLRGSAHALAARSGVKVREARRGRREEGGGDL